MARVFVGIDPGVHGAVAIIDGDDAATIYQIPIRVEETKSPKKGKPPRKKRVIVASELAALLRPVRSDAIVTLETSPPFARAGRTMGVLSAWQQGLGIGLCQGVLAGLGLRYALVAPGTWKRFFELLGEDKKASIGLALDFYPEAEIGKDDNRADALLLAIYGREQQ